MGRPTRRANQGRNNTAHHTKQPLHRPRGRPKGYSPKLGYIIKTAADKKLLSAILAESKKIRRKARRERNLADQNKPGFKKPTKAEHEKVLKSLKKGKAPKKIKKLAEKSLVDAASGAVEEGSLGISRDFFSQYGSIPNGFQYFKNVVKELDPIHSTLKEASAQLKRSAVVARAIRDKEKCTIREFLLTKKPSKKEVRTFMESYNTYDEVLKNIDKEDEEICRKTYDFIDTRIQKMDADLNRPSIYELLAAESKPQEVVYEEELVKLAKKSKLKKKKAKKTQEVVKPQATPFDPNAVEGMPVDPFEPTYCHCNQVSWGEMIACDGDECPYEWYHFSCVGITRKPVGKWFCPFCLRKQNEKAGLKTD